MQEAINFLESKGFKVQERWEGNWQDNLPPKLFYDISRGWETIGSVTGYETLFWFAKGVEVCPTR